MSNRIVHCNSSNVTVLEFHLMNSVVTVVSQSVSCKQHLPCCGLTILTVLWIGFLSQWAHFTVHRSICVYLRVFCVFLFHTAYVLY